MKTETTIKDRPRRYKSYVVPQDQIFAMLASKEGWHPDRFIFWHTNEIPEDAKVVRFGIAEDITCCEFIIEHPSFPDLPVDGNRIPSVTTSFKRSVVVLPRWIEQIIRDYDVARYDPDKDVLELQEIIDGVLGKFSSQEQDATLRRIVHRLEETSRMRKALKDFLAVIQNEFHNLPKNEEDALWDRIGTTMNLAREFV